MNNLKEIADSLQSIKKAVLTAHVMPDGDCVGSLLGMQIILSKLGIQSTIVLNDPIPTIYDFLPGVKDIKRPDDFPEDCDSAISLDCTGFDRMGEKVAAKIQELPTIINVDHHVSNAVFGQYNYIDSNAAATGEIIFELAQQLNLEIEKDFAKCIYTAIAMDTGGFMFENTKPRSHFITGKLMETGINTALMNKYLFDNKELVQLKLLGYALTNLKTAGNGKIAWTTIPLQVLKEIGALDEHADGIVNYPRAVRGVEIGVLIRELEPGKYKAGFRSKTRVDANKLAAIFGGGGHPRASGCTITGSVEEVEKRIVEECIRALDNE